MKIPITPNIPRIHRRGNPPWLPAASVGIPPNARGEHDGLHWKTGRHGGLPLRGREKGDTWYEIRGISKIPRIHRRGNPPWLPAASDGFHITHVESTMACIGRRAGTGACPYGDGEKTTHGMMRSGASAKSHAYTVGATPCGCPRRRSCFA